MSMKLRLIRPTEEKNFTIDWLEIETPAGNFVIHGGHAPTLLSLLPDHDIIFKLKSGRQEAVRLSGGMVEITRESATIICSE